MRLVAAELHAEAAPLYHSAGSKIHPRFVRQVLVHVQKNLVQSLLGAAIKWTHVVHT